MKKTIFLGAIFTVLSTPGLTEDTQSISTSQQPTNSVSSTTPSTNQTNSPTLNPVMPQQNDTTAPGQTITPMPTQNNEPNPTLPQTSTQPQQPFPLINCDYKIPPEIKKIDQSLVLNWSEKATLQSFDFSSPDIDHQMQRLQPCFTDQGWIGFNEALQKSGNIEAIKSQKLTVNSQIDGQTQVTEIKDNQWKIHLPVQVVYQNEQEKVIQLLNIDLTVGRKISGDLGIMQLIATPRVNITPEETNQNSSSTPATQQTDQPSNSQNPTTNTKSPTTDEGKEPPTTHSVDNANSSNINQ